MPALAIALAALALVALLIVTPGGLLTKADLVGYAVCHQIASHSFSIAGRQLPLCARCTGTFLGALMGLFGQAVVLRRRRAAEFPPAPIIVLLVSGMMLWAADGVNSYLALIRAPHLYEPRNWLRLTTGALNGLAMSAIVYPIFNITVWHRPGQERTIRNALDLVVLLLLEASMVGTVLSRWPPLLYPLALLSAAGVLTLLTGVNSILVVTIMRSENAAEHWHEAIIPLLAGFVVSLIQVIAIDLTRYALTGTLEGLTLPQ